MKVQRLVLTIGLIFTFVTGLLAADENSLTLGADRDDCIYALGDTAVFSVSCNLKGAALDYRLSLDGAGDWGSGELSLSGSKAAVQGALDQPGVLRLEVTAVSGADTLRERWGVVFSPLAVRAAGVLPDDFDRFWNQGKAELLRVPMDAQIKEMPDEGEGSKLYQVSLGNIEGSRLICWYRVPPGDGPFPAVLATPGAGVRREGTRELYANNGFAVLTMSIHGIDQDQEKDYYTRLNRELLSGYQFFGIDNPYRYYYRRVVLGTFRCLDFLESRPEVDKDRIVAAGSSQGGGLSLIVAGLDKRIKALAANVPALCDHAGGLHGRPSGWPHAIRRCPDLSAGKVLETMSYFDAALMASRIEVPALLTAGLIDGTCAPTTIMAAFNNLRGPRRLEVVPGMGHEFPDNYDTRSIQWLHDALAGKVSGVSVVKETK